MRLVGVGLEPLGLEEFIEGKFFDGGEKLKFTNYSSTRTCNFHLHFPELFVDSDKQTFKTMGFQRFSFLSLFSLFRSKKWTDANSMVRVIISFVLRGPSLRWLPFVDTSKHEMRRGILNLYKSGTQNFMSQSLALDQMGHPVHLGQGNARQSIYALHEPPIQAKKMNLGGNLRGDGFQVKRIEGHFSNVQ